MRSLLIAVALLCLVQGGAAQFSPDGGRPGSSAVHPDSAEFVAWASSVTFSLGPVDIRFPDGDSVPLASSPDAVLGPASGEVQPLGDGGTATLGFAEPVADQLGPEFVVFENGFPTSATQGFFELAFVEASSDGVNFVRWPNTSLTDTNRGGTFVELDSRLIEGLAGKVSAPYGVAFDLADLPTDTLLDITRVTHVRLVDVVGTSGKAYATRDSEGSVIVDPYPTPFASGGFDLDAVGVLAPAVADTTTSSVTDIARRGFAERRKVLVVSQEAFNQLRQTPTLLIKYGSNNAVSQPQNMRWYDAQGRALGTFAPSDKGSYFLCSGESGWPVVLQILVH